MIGPGEEIDGYRVIEQIGEGGFCRVFKVFDRNNEPFCMKLWKQQSLGEGISSDALREIAFLSQIKHAGVISLLKFSFCPAQNTLYTVYDLVPVDLDRYIKTN